MTDKPLTSGEQLNGRWTIYSTNRGQVLTSGVKKLIPVIKLGKEVSILYKTTVQRMKASGTQWRKTIREI